MSVRKKQNIIPQEHLLGLQTKLNPTDCSSEFNLINQSCESVLAKPPVSLVAARKYQFDDKIVFGILRQIMSTQARQNLYAFSSP